MKMFLKDWSAEASAIMSLRERLVTNCHYLPWKKDVQSEGINKTSRIDLIEETVGSFGKYLEMSFIPLNAPSLWVLTKAFLSRDQSIELNKLLN